MSPFTQYQKEELIGLIQIRRDTVEEDPDSGDTFELTPNALNELEAKVESGSTSYNVDEKMFLKAECENRIAMANSNRGHGDNVNGLIASMENVIEKLNH